MTDYYCNNCKFRFTVKAGKPLPNKCPYCSQADTFEKVKNAQDLLDEIVPSDDED